MKCVVITPIGPGHEALARECQATVQRAWAADRGLFSAMEHSLVDDTRGLLGRSEARNRAVHLAAESGADWIFFLDADDGMLPGAFRAVAPFLDGHDAVWGSIVEMKARQSALQFRTPQVLTLESFAEVLLHDPYLTLQMGHFVRAAVAAQHPFDTDMNTGEDFDYYLRLWEKHRCRKVRDVFFVNRRGLHSSGPRSADGNQWRVAVERLLGEARTKAGIVPGSPAAHVVVNAKTIEYRDWLRGQRIASRDLPYPALSAVFPFHGELRVDCFKTAPFNVVSENDDPAARSIFWTGTFQPEVMEVWLRGAQQAGEVVDAGSFGGLYGLAAAAQDPQTRVSFVHPLAENRSRIQRNLDANAFAQKPRIFSSLAELAPQGGAERCARMLVGLDRQFTDETVMRGVASLLAAVAPDVLVHGHGPEGWERHAEIFAERGYHFHRIAGGGTGLEASDRFGNGSKPHTGAFLLTTRSP